jgi:60 kDa SS-A/Ro ribonucleoprotein
MANKSLFASYAGKLLPKAGAKNREGAPAYALSPRHQLAQIAATGTLSRTFYAAATEQLEDVTALARQASPRFIAQAAIWARRRGHMKDMPALLLAVLSTQDTVLLARVFPRVIDNGRMLRTFVQIMRSGAVGRKSLGSRPKALVAAWLNAASEVEILRAAVGQSPSLADVIRMVHPKPASAERQALYAYLIGKPYDVAMIPPAVQAFEAFKRDARAPVPDVPFQMLTALGLTPQHWAAIAKSAGWQMLRMNLNTFDRQGVFALAGFAQMIAKRLSDPVEIAKSRVLPYQLMAAYMASKQVPAIVREALQDAMETSIANVPAIAGNVVICPDVSGSMGSPVTGVRRGATSVVRCIDVAALVAAAMLRANRAAHVLPFENDVVEVDLNPRDTVLTNAAKLAAIGGGGTNCSAPLARLNAQHAKVDLVVFVSDNQSWIDARGTAQGTGVMGQWTKLKSRNPAARLVCIDIEPYGTTQAPERDDILNVGGFSDAVFEVVAKFASGRLDSGHWVAEIEKIEV